MTVPTPSLDTGTEPWVGRFPGLGEVRVHADGAVETLPAPGEGEGESGESPELREQALRWGWGDLLSWRRRGFDLLGGVAATPPPYDGAVLLAGDGAIASAWLTALAAAGWRFLADRPAPALVRDGLTTLHPRHGPLLAARADFPACPPAREDTDAVLAEVPRHTAELPLRAVVLLDQERVHQPPLQEVRGAERLPVALGLLGAGVLGPAEHSPAARFATARSLATVPVLRARCGSDTTLLPAVLAWVSGAGVPA